MTQPSPYLSPTRVRHADPAPGQPLRLEVTALSGRGYLFREVPVEGRRLVLTLSGRDTLTDLLAQTLAGFGLDEWEHLAQFRLHRTRGRVGDDEDRWPWAARDVVYALYEPDDDWDWDSDEALPGRDVAVSRVLGQGQVGYLRFDFGDEWWWRVRAVAVGDQALGPEVLPGLVFAQYDDPDADETWLARARDPD